jgi:hypothetical protein
MMNGLSCENRRVLARSAREEEEEEEINARFAREEMSLRSAKTEEEMSARFSRGRRAP